MTTCRLAGELFSIPLFKSIACARCLLYIYMLVPPYSERYVTSMCESGLLVCDRRNPRFVEECRCENAANIFNLPEFGLNRSLFTPLSEISISPRLPHDFAFFTQQCCEAADRCCNNVLTRPPSVSEPTVTHAVRKCPATWDGWQCFPDSDPGVAVAKCPNYIYGDRTRGDIDHLMHARKECTPNGTWHAVVFDNGELNEWTDYRFCQHDNASTVKMVLGLIAFSITVLCIIPAIFCLSWYRTLASQAVFIIHKHLLLSFLGASVTFILNCLFFVVDGAPLDHFYFTNHFSCRLLFTVQLRYFRLATFTWMLAEGVYLYRLLSPFKYDHENLSPYKVVCWGVPLIITVIYSILRQTFDNDECWVSPSEVWWVEWMVTGPCLLLICLNFVLLLLILYVVLRKIRFSPPTELEHSRVMEPAQYWKALRVVLCLMPVFGLHFLFTIYRMPWNAHQIVNLILDGVQGALVSLIVFYTNKGVQECIFGSLKKWKLIRELNYQSSTNREKFIRDLRRETRTSLIKDKKDSTSDGSRNTVV